MFRTTAVRAALLALVLALAGSFSTTAASAATVTLQPSPAEARTFATTNGGWSSAVDYNGLVCIPGVTCPAANPSYQAANGAGGASDGFLRNSFGTLLGVLSTTTISWSSPTFVAPASTSASLSFKVRPQIASLLAIGSVNVTASLVDVADGTQTTTLPSTPLTAASASFSTINLTVPPSAVVAGRTYRVRIATALTTAVSAVTSGNVDIDDVVLTLTDAVLPTGLTASVPATGPTRVVGSVNAQGLNTDVTVDYGLTTAYGTTTSPVALSGSTSGSQPFSIPLTGLTPGATYHYRVNATNADGTVRTTDATFVAPSAPSTAAPSVSGAATSPTRTVTFTRAADVTSAVVELLDSGGTVIDSYPDSDGDGSVGITLPGDGSYSVRVVRTNDAGLSSTSTSTPLLLDTAAPDAGPAPTVTGADSDRDRTVTFTRAPDASTVLVEVLDGGGSVIDTIPVPSGNSADITLPNADGDYSVRVKQTDAAGNSATSPGKPISLDRSAPDLSALGLTLTPSVSNDQERTVTIVRPADAATVTAQVIDANGDPVGSPVTITGNSGTVTLGASDGAYRVVVTVADAAGNSDDRTSAAVTLDTAAPDAGPAPTVTGASNSRDRTVTFTRAPDAANVTIELLDDGGNVIDTFPVASGGSGSITLPPGDGSYRVRVKQTDAAGNSATTPSTSLTLDRTGPDAGPAPTATGPPDDLTVTFVRAPDAVSATIEVRDSNGTLVGSVPVPTGNTGTVHLPAGIGQYTISVVQFDADGNSGTTPNLTVERPAPGGPGNPGGGNPGGGSPGAGDPGGGTPPGAGPPKQRDPDQLDRCTKPSLVLTGVTLRNGRARISGWTASDPGTKVTIQDQARKQVATATVEASGSFTATVRPRAGVKRSALRYYAALDGKRSIGLQLLPANALTNVVRTGSTLTLRGRVDLKRVGAIKDVDAIGGTGDCPGTTTGFKPLGKPTINRRTGTYRLQVRADEGARLIVRTRVTGVRNRARSGYVVR